MKKKYWKQRALEAESKVAELKEHLMFALLPVPKLLPINDRSLREKIEESKEIFNNKRKEHNENATSNCTCINDRITLPGDRRCVEQS